MSHTARYPELVLTFEPDAKELFDSYQVFFNIRCTKCRLRQDADAAAEEGAPRIVSWIDRACMTIIAVRCMYASCVHAPSVCVCDRYRTVEARDAICAFVPVGHHVEADGGPSRQDLLEDQGYSVAM